MHIQSSYFSFADILSTMNIYDNSLCSLPFNKDEPKSAVAIIVKRSKKQTALNQAQNFILDQILFLQRKKSPNDRFSGQICFPGGRQEPGQTLLNAAIRQTFEQTNLKLQQQHLIGCIGRQVNFIISTRKQQKQSSEKSSDRTLVRNPQRQMVVYGFIFCVQKEQIQQQILTLNHHEMETYNWVPARQLMTTKNICWLDYTQKIKSLTKVYQQKPNIKQYRSSALNCVSRVLSPAMDVKMNEKIYGITLYLLLIILKQFINSSACLGDKLYQSKNLLCNLREIRARCEAYVIFEVNNPITKEFSKFESALMEGLYTMRPKL